jgi:hypothetical protein
MTYGLRPEPGRTWPQSTVRVRWREICASGSVNAAREGFGTPAAVKKPLCQPTTLGASLTRNQISRVVPGCSQTRSAL